MPPDAKSACAIKSARTALGNGGRRPTNGSLRAPRPSKAALAREASAILRAQLVAEIQSLADGDDLALRAHWRLAAKNTLTTEDAGLVEGAYRAVLDTIGRDAGGPSRNPAAPPGSNGTDSAYASWAATGQAPVSPRPKEVRRRNKAHRAFDRRANSSPCSIS